MSLVGPNIWSGKAFSSSEVVEMDKTPNPFLVESDASKAELVNPGEYLEDPPTVNGEVNGMAGSVGSGEPSGTYTGVMLRAAVTGVDRQGELDYHSETIKSVDKIGDHLVFTTATATGELRKFEVLPHELAFIP